MKTQSRSSKGFVGTKVWILILSLAVIGLGLFFGITRFGERSQLQSRLPVIPEMTGHPDLLKKALEQQYTKIGYFGDVDSELLELGMLYHANRFFAEALQVYKLAQEKNPENARIAYLTSDVYQSVSDFEAFKNALENTLELGLQHGPVFVKLGRMALKERDYEKSESLLKRALEMDSNSIQVLDSLLSLYSRTGAEGKRQVVESHRSWLAPESIGSNDPILDSVYDFCYDSSQLLVLADLSIKRRDFDKGAFFLDRAIAIDERDWKAYAIQLILEQERGDIEAAIAAGYAAIDNGADVGIAISQIVTMLSDKGENERAKQVVLEAIAVHSDEPELYQTLSTVQKEGGQFGPAYESLLKAEALLPSSADICNSKGELLWDMGRKDEAAVCFKRGVSLSPFEGKPHMYLAQYYIEKNKLSNAEKYVREAISLEPENELLVSMAADYFEFYGSQELENGNFSNAVRLLQSGSDLSPTNVRLTQKLADALFKGGRHEEGAVLLDSLVKSGSANPEVYMALGEISLSNKELGKARQYYEQAVARGNRSSSYSTLVAAATKRIEQIEALNSK